MNIHTDLAAEGAAAESVSLGDELEALSAIRSPHRIRSFAFSPAEPTRSSSSSSSSGLTQKAAGGGGEYSDKALLSLVNNSLEVYKVPHAGVAGADGGPVDATPSKLSIIDLHGHRCVRACVGSRSLMHV